MSRNYSIHPSPDLQKLFASVPVPYQGQDPRNARAIFVGLDANYAPELFSYPAFRDRILEYHRDGAAFWKRHGVHHPFLLEDYPLQRTSGGVPYHRKFGKMGLTPEFAEYISFVELLNVPTTGSTDRKKFWELFDLDYAKRLDRIFAGGKGPRLVLFPKSVIDYMLAAKARHGIFQWLPKKTDWGPIGRIGQTEFYKVRHFSGAIKNEQIAEIGDLVRRICAST